MRGICNPKVEGATPFRGFYTNMESIQKLYDEVQKKKKKLPSFDELDKDFEISDVDDVNFFLRKFRRKMIEKLTDFNGNFSIEVEF